MPIERAAQTSQHFTGRGQLLIAPFGTKNFRGLGNCQAIAINTASNRIQAYDHQRPGLPIAAAHYQGIDQTIAFTLNSVQKSVMELLTRATATAVVGATVTAEAQTIAAGQEFLQLNRTNVTTWTSLTSAPPGTTYVENTDYQVAIPQGTLRILPGGALAGGLNVLANYTAGATTQYRIGSLNPIRVALTVDAFSDDDKNKLIRFNYPNVILSQENVFNLINEDYNTFDLMGTAIFDPVLGQFGTMDSSVTV